MDLQDKVEIYETNESSILNFNNSSRFIIVCESLSFHCCFEFTIIDTEKGKTKCGNFWKKKMCETFDKYEALMICYSLNQAFNS